MTGLETLLLMVGSTLAVLWGISWVLAEVIFHLSKEDK